MTDPMLGPRSTAAFTLPKHPSTGQPNAPIARYLDPPPPSKRPPDVVVLSHGHADHFDDYAKRTLPQSTLFIIPPSVEGSVRDAGFSSTTALDWGEQTTLSTPEGRVVVSAVPAHHADDPKLDTELGKVNGYVFAWEDRAGRYTIYWTGDSVFFDGMAEIPQRFGTIDLLVADLGAVGVDGSVGRRSLDADEALRVFAVVRAKSLIPIHHTTFGHYREPIEALQQRAAGAGIEAELLLLRTGGIAPFPNTGSR